MDNEQEQTSPEEQGYVERPWWQVWGARILLVVFLAIIAVYYFCIAKGGA